MTDDVYTLKGNERVTPISGITLRADGTRTVLTIHRDGRLEFAPHAHPEEAVKILLDVWRKYVPPCECRHHDPRKGTE